MPRGVDINGGKVSGHDWGKAGPSRDGSRRGPGGKERHRDGAFFFRERAAFRLLFPPCLRQALTSL